MSLKPRDEWETWTGMHRRRAAHPLKVGAREVEKLTDVANRVLLVHIEPECHLECLLVDGFRPATIPASAS